MSAPSKVHVVVPHFSAITEFAGYKDDCGPCANQVCCAAIEGRAPSVQGMNEMRRRDLAAGKFRVGNGQTIAELKWDVDTFPTPKIATTLYPYDTPLEGLKSLHQALHDACLRGNPCVLNLALAGSLPGNEANIHYHFVAVGGIDTDLGYLIANGDALKLPTVGTYWVKWPDLVKAQPFALLEYHMRPVAPPPPPPTMDPAPDYHALYEALLAKVTAAKTALA
jgi:hypothetical protein